MTTIRQIINDAFREGGITPVGGVPEGDEFDEALRKLQQIVRAFVGTELGENLTTLSFGKGGLSNVYGLEADVSSALSQRYLPDNSRVIFNAEAAETLYLSPSPPDGARVSVIDNRDNFATYPLTLDGNGRSIENATTVTASTDGFAREWFYRADLGNWVRLVDFTATEESPFPSDFDDFLVTSLAIRLNPKFGATTSGETLDALSRGKKAFKARYRQSREVHSELGFLGLSTERQRLQDSTTRFNLGLV